MANTKCKRQFGAQKNFIIRKHNYNRGQLVGKKELGRDVTSC